MRYMLDSNICIHIINHASPKLIARLVKHEGDLCISTIVAAELQFGAAKSAAQKKNRASLAEFLAPLEILPFDEDAAASYGDLRATLEKSGKPIDPLDTLIAAHALSLGATVVTNNLREFQRVKGLRVESWA
jgi:tRNA(fMet)-specific endonuclease VapC